MIRNLKAILVLDIRSFSERLLRMPEKDDLVYVTKPGHEPILTKTQRIGYSTEFRDERTATEIFDDIASVVNGRVEYVSETQFNIGGYFLVAVPNSQRQETLKRLEDYFGPGEIHRVKRRVPILDDHMIF